MGQWQAFVDPSKSKEYVKLNTNYLDKTATFAVGLNFNTNSLNKHPKGNKDVASYARQCLPCLVIISLIKFAFCLLKKLLQDYLRMSYLKRLSITGRWYNNKKSIKYKL